LFILYAEEHFSRPVWVLAYPQSADARALVMVASLTSQIRSLRGEVPLGKPRWLPKISAVNVQGLASFDPGKLARRLGTLSEGLLSELLPDSTGASFPLRRPDPSSTADASCPGH